MYRFSGFSAGVITSNSVENCGKYTPELSRPQQRFRKKEPELHSSRQPGREHQATALSMP
jgi:hypothetical protein